MRLLIPAFAALFFYGFSSSFAYSAARNDTVVVTRVVGQVDDRFVTSREVKINDAVDQALTSRAGARKVLTGEEATFPNNVSRVLDEWAVDLEAVYLAASRPPPAEINKSIQTILEYWSSKPRQADGGAASAVSAAEWRELEVSSDELRHLVERKLMSREFERLRGDVALIPVTDADAQSYYQKNRLRFGSLPFETFKENIKTFLAKQQIEGRLAEWHESLRRKYKVRNFISG